MTRFAFVTWDGGGNLGPAIGIAQELVARGHDVRFLGYQPQRAGIEARGFAFTALAQSGAFDLYGNVPANQRLAAITRNVWACPEHLQDIPEALEESSADVLVVDFSMQGALAVAAQTRVPMAVLAHSGIGAFDTPAGVASWSRPIDCQQPGARRGRPTPAGAPE